MKMLESQPIQVISSFTKQPTICMFDFDEELDGHEPEQEKCLKIKKKVSFADDRGLNLESIFVIKESPMPNSYLDEFFLNSFLPRQMSNLNMLKPHNDEFKFSAPPLNEWEFRSTLFTSDFHKFSAVLHNQNVLLETAVVSENSEKMTGTIRVKNLAFEKQVIIRYTENRWESFFDKPAFYKKTNNENLETFEFEIDLPLPSQKRREFEFCICYRAGTGNERQEFWDNNSGKNYSLIAKTRAEKEENLMGDKKRKDSNGKQSARFIVVQSQSDNYYPYNDFGGWIY